MPFQTDFGKAILLSWEEGKFQPLALDSIFLQIPNFHIIPQARRNVLMNLCPGMVRDHYRTGKKEEVIKVFQDLISGNNQLTTESVPDVAMELLEWIFSGFEDAELVCEVLSIFCEDKAKFNSEFFSLLKKNYQALLNQEISG